MRILSSVFGALLFVAGMALLVTGAISAVSRADDAGSGRYDWTCTAQNSVQQCSYGSSSVPRAQAEITGFTALTVAGAGMSVCGALFVLIGSQRFPRTAVPAVPAGYPQQVQAYPPR